MSENPSFQGGRILSENTSSVSRSVDIVLPDGDSDGVDIPLDIPQKGYDATVPEELRKERGDTTPAGELAREAKKQMEYIQLTQLYTALQALADQHVLPGDYRQALPQEIDALISELTPEFRGLSLYRSVTEEQVKRELEGRVRRQELGQKIAELQELIRASKVRIGEMQASQRASVSPSVENGLMQEDAARVAVILEKMRADKEFKAMPVVRQSEPETAPDTAFSGSFFAGIKQLLKKK